MSELNPDQREQPTTKVELPPGMAAKVTGPSTAELQPGSKIEPSDAATAMLPPWAKVGAQMTAIAVVLGLFTWGYFRNESRFDEAIAQVNSNTKARADELKAFRDWTEARLDKQQDREDAMRSKLWAVFSNMAVDLKVLLSLHDGALHRAMDMKKGKQ